MIHRALQLILKKLIDQTPVLTVTGPRQSGKTTLTRGIFKDASYVNLEFEDTSEFARQDPRGFLDQFNALVIIDEVQRVPSLVRYIQGYADERGRDGQYVLTGSQNILLSETLSESLAGRSINVLLLPFSLQELQANNIKSSSYEECLFRGFYPRLIDKDLAPDLWLPSYIQTYLERDIRKIVNVQNLATFHRFLQLCAGRAGQLLNYSALARDAGVDEKTVRRWVSLLEMTHIVFLLRPYHSNFNKRLTKSPKLYFWDTGLVCSLLNIERQEYIAGYYNLGALFENFIISEIGKNFYNTMQTPNWYFWRDSHGNEVDLLIELPNHIKACEIKSSKTLSSSHFSGLKHFEGVVGTSATVESVLVYGGNSSHKRQGVEVLSWQGVSHFRPE